MHRTYQNDYWYEEPDERDFDELQKGTLRCTPIFSNEHIGRTVLLGNGETGVVTNVRTWCDPRFGVVVKLDEPHLNHQYDPEDTKTWEHWNGEVYLGLDGEFYDYNSQGEDTYPNFVKFID